MKIKTFFLLFLVLWTESRAATDLNESILAEYLKLQKEFYQTTCGPGTEETFHTLDRNYKGSGNFIPVLLEDRVDLKTIKSHMPLLREKETWIQSQIDHLSKLADFESLIKLLDNIEDLKLQLQEAKREHFFSKTEKQKEEIIAKSSRLFEQLVLDVEKFKNHAPFLLSFKFPLNHLELRSEYEKNKSVSTKEARSKSNAVYFYRKIVQDGSFDAQLLRNDSVIRSVFDTLYLSLTKDKKRNFLTDAERVDLKFVVANFRKLLSIKPDVMLERFAEWKMRNGRSLSFYQDLLDGKKLKVSEQSQITDVTTLLEERARSLYTLKDFVLSREAKAYEYWASKSELHQALYAIETILYSEVGRLDTHDALERRDVAQVVINRSQNSKYNFLSDKDPITKFIHSQIKLDNNKWLNVLFKEGEFSFTYFYIPGNLHIYCPDMSKVGQFLRRENVRIALQLLNKPRENFTAVRYFSRVSMFGRIEMDSLWSSYSLVPETPGRPVKNPKKIRELIKKHGYKYLYHFTDEGQKKSFLVVDLKGKTYVVDSSSNNHIFYYRNPHQFKYFSPTK